MRHKSKLSILIVSYNTRAMTLACLASVIAETRAPDYEIIVVDNASSDGSAAAIAEFAANNAAVKLIPLAGNAGFARGNNLASAHATGRLLLLLNPDTLILDGAIDRLIDVAENNPEALIWGGKTILADGTVDGSCVWRHMDLWGVFCRASGLAEMLPDSPLFNREAYGGWRRDTARTVDMIAGCFMLIERPLWNLLGGFDRQFFMYGEEADLCLRAAANGARPYYTPEAVIIHYGGASEATRIGKVEKLLKGKVTLLQRHWQPVPRAIAKLLLVAWPLSRWLVLGSVGAVTNRPDLAERAAVWQAIWRRREHWLAGYAEPQAIAEELPPATTATISHA